MHCKTCMWLQCVCLLGLFPSKRSVARNSSALLDKSVSAVHSFVPYVVSGNLSHCDRSLWLSKIILCLKSIWLALGCCMKYGRMWHPAGSMSCALAWPPARAWAEEGNAHQKSTVVHSFLPLPLLVPERRHSVSPVRFTKAAFPGVLITRFPEGDASALLRVGGGLLVTSMMWDAQCKITLVIGTELDECEFLSGQRWLFPV